MNLLTSLQAKLQDLDSIVMKMYGMVKSTQMDIYCGLKQRIYQELALLDFQFYKIQKELST